MMNAHCDQNNLKNLPGWYFQGSIHLFVRTFWPFWTPSFSNGCILHLLNVSNFWPFSDPPPSLVAYVLNGWSPSEPPISAKTALANRSLAVKRCPHSKFWISVTTDLKVMLQQFVVNSWFTWLKIFGTSCPILFNSSFSHNINSSNSVVPSLFLVCSVECRLHYRHCSYFCLLQSLADINTISLLKGKSSPPNNKKCMVVLA